MNGLSNRFTLAAIAILGFSGIVGITYLSAISRPIPDSLTAMVAASIGSLATYIVPVVANGGLSDGSKR